MTNQTKNAARRPQPPRRRRQNGISLMLVVVLLIIAILLGGVVGFLLSRRADPKLHELQEAQDRITELENTLTLIGFSEDSDDPEDWIYDDGVPDDAAQDLSGDDDEDDDENVWTEDSLLSGMLKDDGDPVVVAEFDGGQLLSTEVIPEYNDQLTSQVFAGNSAEDVSQSLLQSVMSDMVSDKIIAVRAQSLGLTDLTDADLAEINKAAAANYADQLDEYIAYTEQNREEEEGGEPADAGEADAQALRDEAAKRLKEESGVTQESIASELKETWWMQKFYDYTVKDVTITDEEVQTYYDELLADQKIAFPQYPESFEYAHLNGDAVTYRPEGFRAVRDILIPFPDNATATRASELTDKLEFDSGDAEAREQLEALYAPLDATAQEVLEKLSAGQSFDSLMSEYGCSEDLNTDKLKTEGFYITDSSFVNSVEFVEGSLLLDTPGDISTPLRSVYGVHLVQYIGDVPAGEVPLEEIRDEVRAEALDLKRSEYYEAQREAMLEQANVRYYPERLF